MNSFHAWFALILRWYLPISPFFFFSYLQEWKCSSMRIHMCVRSHVVYKYNVVYKYKMCASFWISNPARALSGKPSSPYFESQKPVFMPYFGVLQSARPKKQCKRKIFPTFLYCFLACGCISPYLCTRNRDAGAACPARYAPWRKRRWRWKSGSRVAAIFEMIP